MDNQRQPFDGDYSRSRLLAEITGQMIKGSIVAGAVFFGPVVFIYVIYLVGTLLPPESKEAADPTPDSFSYYERVIDIDQA